MSKFGSSTLWHSFLTTLLIANIHWKIHVIIPQNISSSQYWLYVMTLNILPVVRNRKACCFMSQFLYLSGVQCICHTVYPKFTLHSLSVVLKVFFVFCFFGCEINEGEYSLFKSSLFGFVICLRNSITKQGGKMSCIDNNCFYHPSTSIPISNGAGKKNLS